MDHRPHRSAGSFIVLFGIIVYVVAVGGTVSSRQADHRNAQTFGLATQDEAALPETMTLHRLGGHLMVDVNVDDGAPLAMLLDTGSATSISAAVAARVGAAPTGIVAYTTPDGVVSQKATVSIGEIRLGQSPFRDVGAIVEAVEPDSPLADVAAHGIIGANVMAGAVWQIDLAGGQLTIARSATELEHVKDALSLPFEPASGASPSPLVHLSIGSGRLPFLVDTGSDGGLALHPDDLARLGHVASPTGVQENVLLASASGRHESSVLAVSARLQLGDDGPKLVTLYASDVMTPGLGLAGNAFLDDYVLTIDWPARMLYLDPVNEIGASASPTLRSASSADQPARSRR